MVTRTTFILDDALAERARSLGINVSAAAREGVAAAVRAALAEQDRRGYERSPEAAESSLADAEVWGAE
jgi:post-segregation antitoxin (ccd killing protein)